MAEDFKLEPTEKDDARDVYKELVEFVGSESTLLFLVISKFKIIFKHQGKIIGSTGRKSTVPSNAKSHGITYGITLATPLQTS